MDNGPLQAVSRIPRSPRRPSTPVRTGNPERLDRLTRVETTERPESSHNDFEILVPRMMADVLEPESGLLRSDLLEIVFVRIGAAPQDFTLVAELDGSIVR